VDVVVVVVQNYQSISVFAPRLIVVFNALQPSIDSCRF
jgi:hypothetical protein